MKHLVVAEKPSVGRDIARVLQCGDKQQGFISGADYIVTWGIGHLVTNCMPEDFDPALKAWSLDALPIMPDPLPIKVISSTKKQFDIVSGLMNNPEIGDIICATDAGREGELIFRYIYQMANCTKPVQRLWISSMTPQAIREGFQQLRSDADYDNLYQSALCRSDADWLIGINCSRVYTLLGGTLLSVGRVQTPTLKILVDREKERRYFVPKKYGTLEVDFGSCKGKWFDPTKEGDASYQFDESRFDEMNKLKESLIGTEVVVSNYKTEIKKTSAPLLYDLTSLQRDANKQLGYSAKKTLSIAQDLYEKRKAITYPRTDSRCLSHDMVGTLKGRLQKLTLPPWAEGVKAAISNEKNLFGRFINDSKVSDHHAIIPTGYSCDGADWTDGEKKLFDLIARRFIAMFLPDREVEEQVLVAKDEQGNLFRASGKRVLSDGWDMISVSQSEPVQSLPDSSLGSGLYIKDVQLKAHETTPPAPHTDASLLYAMEHAGAKILPEDPEATDIGLGTPATRAETIEKIISRGYAKRIGKKAIVPTDAGIKLIETLPEKLTTPVMTVDWEKQLAEIGSGTKDPYSFMSDIRRLTSEIVSTAAVSHTFGHVALGQCPICGGKVYEGKAGKNYYCQNKTCNFNVWKRAASHPFISPEDMAFLLKNGTIKNPSGTITLVKEDPFVQFEKTGKAPFIPVKVNEKELTEFLLSKGIRPVSLVAKKGNYWIPGGFIDIKPIIQEINLTFHVSAGFSQAAKALKNQPGWFIKGGYFVK